MLDILASFLAEAATPEVKDSIEQAHAVFERIELLDYEGTFVELLQTDDTTDTGETVQAIVEATRRFQQLIIDAHLVSLTEDSEMDMRTKFIEALLDLPDYEDTDAVFSCLSMGLNNEETLAELLAFVSEHNAAEWLAVLQEVSSPLLQKLRELTAPLMQEDRGSGMGVQMRTERIGALTRLSKHLLGQSLLLVEYINEGSDIGYPFAVYASEMGSKIEGLPVDQAAAELLAMCFASYDGFDSPISLIKQNLETLVSNVDTATKIMVRVGQLVLQMQLTPEVTKAN